MCCIDMITPLTTHVGRVFIDLIRHYGWKRMDGEADADAARCRERGKSWDFGGKSAERGNTPRLEMSNGRTRKKARDVDEEDEEGARSLAPAARPTACMQIETRGSLARSVGRQRRNKSFKTGKRMSTTLARSVGRSRSVGRPRPPTSLRPPDRREDISCCCYHRHRRCFLFLSFSGKGNGGAKRSFITQAAWRRRRRGTPPTSSTGRATKSW